MRGQIEKERGPPCSGGTADSRDLLRTQRARGAGISRSMCLSQGPARARAHMDADHSPETAAAPDRG